MNVKALAIAAGLASVVLVCVTVLLLNHIDTTAIVAVISVVATPVIGAVLYSKVETISQQTNGTSARQASLLESVVEHLKTHNTVPIPEAVPPNTTTTVTTSNVAVPTEEAKA